jgi:transcriptional regulator with XRE-family HTH domain
MSKNIVYKSNMSSYIQTAASFSKQLKSLAERARALRILRNLTQAELANRCRVGIATIVRFERSGNTSLENALRIAYALGVEDGFERLFDAPKFRSLDEAIAEDKGRSRQRVRKPS